MTAREAAPVRLGIVGVGALALRALLPHLTQEDVRPALVVRALCDPVAARGAAAAASTASRGASGTIEELVADDEIDAVTIASPIGLHAEHVRIALTAGKHVHVNKTLSTTVAEATELIELAAANGLRLVASPGEVLRPQLARTRELITAGAIGRAELGHLRVRVRPVPRDRGA